MISTLHASKASTRENCQPTDSLQPPEYLVPAEAKQLAQKLRYLRDDLKLAYPKLPTPSSWMVHCLALSYLKYHVEDSARYHSSTQQQRLFDFLNTIKSVAAGEISAMPLVEPDTQTSLFPNTEEYSIEQLRTFSELALAYLGSES